MTVVEGFICEKNIVFAKTDNNYSLSIPEAVTSLLIEGIAHNTTGSVFMPQVFEIYIQRASVKSIV